MTLTDLLDSARRHLIAHDTEYHHVTPLELLQELDEAKTQAQALEQEAMMARWLLTALRIERPNPGSFSCALTLAIIPYRSSITEPKQLLLELMRRFPQGVNNAG
jgi:hypothetical protein